MFKQRIQKQITLTIGLSLVIAATVKELARGEESTDKGAELIEKEGCLHCHFIKGDGGFVGPPLDGIGKYRSQSEITETLLGTRPRPYDFPRGVLDPSDLMRHVRLSKSSAQEIARYLVTLEAPDKGLKIEGHGKAENDRLPEGFKFEPRPPSDSSRKGLSAYKDSGCAACHSIGGLGGRIGPSLDGIGARRSRDYIEQRISEGAIVVYSGTQYRPTKYSMPPAKLSQQEITQITDFLFTLRKKEK
jgi:cytochrome c2